MMQIRRSIKHLLVTAVASMSLLVGCGVPMLSVDGSDQGKLSAKAHKPGELSLYVMPEAGHQPILDAINSAKKSIWLEMYLLTYSGVTKEITDALIAKSKAGVDVRIILENQPFVMPVPPKPGELPKPPINVNRAALEVLTANGVRVKRSSPQFVFTHQKSMIIDGQSAWIMTMNFSAAAFQKNREYLVVDTSPSDVKELKEIFMADWDERPIVPKDEDLVVSPTNSKDRIIKLIDSAKKDLTVQVEFLDDPDVVAHMGARKKAGANVTVQLSYHAPDKQTGYDGNAKQLKQLNDAGITDVKFIKTVGLHAKLIIADGAKAYIGSENLTTNSLTRNREMGIIIDDKGIVAKLAQVAGKDWAAN
ncbi:hypothetical protein J7643_16530 [bacterium]|nr:hypothetical protein [bacterium]